MKIHGVLYLIVLFAIDTCDCKCDEYIIVLQETTYPGINFKPMKTEALHELSSLYNSTRLYHELDSYNECILEMECKGYSTYCPKKVVVANHGKHSEEITNRTMDKACKTENDTNVCNNTKSDYMVIEDQPVYDLNIIYVGKNDIQNNTDIHNKTKNSMFMVVCVYAENSCNGDDLNKTNLNKFIKMSNDIALNETMKELVLTLKRDEGSMIQPIFTGFASENSTIGSTKNTPLEVTLTCKFIENNHCKRKVNNTSEEMLAVPSSINVYFKSDYIKNGTKIKYTGCKKDSGDKNNTFHIQCDATNFTSNNKDVLYTLTKRPEYNKTLNLHCDITKSNLTTAARRSKDVPQYDNNLLHFNDCYTNQNISNQTNFGGQNMTIVLGRRRVLDNITINDDVKLNKTKVPFTTTEDKININDKNLFQLHITTDKSINCSQNQLFSITEGYVIDKEKYFISEDLPKYNDVELKLLNCLNDTYSVNNNSKTKGQKSKLIIILKHETDINKIDSEQLGEPSEASNIILVCNTTNYNEYEHKKDSSEKKVFECEFVDVNNYTTTDMNSSNTLTNVTNEETIHEENRSVDEENKDSCSSNTTEKTDCAPKCDPENVDGCNNISINDVNNKKNESMDRNVLTEIKEYNFTVGSKNANDSQSNGRDNLTIKNDHSLDRIGLILLTSIAGIGLLLALAFKKCAKRSEYRPAPVRDLQDLEDTAF